MIPPLRTDEGRRTHHEESAATSCALWRSSRALGFGSPTASYSRSTTRNWPTHSRGHPRAQFRQHGGIEGIRYELWSSALARHIILRPTAHRCRCRLRSPLLMCLGFRETHPFFDGNKRTAFRRHGIVLDLNGWALKADDAECISVDGVACLRRTKRESTRHLAAQTYLETVKPMQAHPGMNSRRVA